MAQVLRQILADTGDPLHDAAEGVCAPVHALHTASPIGGQKAAPGEWKCVTFGDTVEVSTLADPFLLSIPALDRQIDWNWRPKSLGTGVQGGLGLTNCHGQWGSPAASGMQAYGTM